MEPAKYQLQNNFRDSLSVKQAAIPEPNPFSSSRSRGNLPLHTGSRSSAPTAPKLFSQNYQIDFPSLPTQAIGRGNTASEMTIWPRAGPSVPTAPFGTTPPRSRKPDSDSLTAFNSRVGLFLGGPDADMSSADALARLSSRVREPEKREPQGVPSFFSQPVKSSQMLDKSSSNSG